jgi:glycosyltransferase involved in cell wall biosynthesis
MRRARAVVFPSLWHEPAGLVTLEAAAAGRPVIASAVGGIPEYATDAFAERVPPGDAEQLAARIDELARAPERAERMGRRARRVAREQFSMESFVDCVHRFYHEIADSSPSS